MILFSPGQIDLFEIVEDILELYFPSAEKKSVKLISSVQKQTILSADSNMLRTILRNLVSNAIKFSFHNTEMHITAWKEKNYMKISVSNHGIGISKEDILRLQNKNDCISTPGTDNEKGSGIGLSICKEFVRRHNGTLEIESEQGQQTTVSFTIPF